MASAAALLESMLINQSINMTLVRAGLSATEAARRLGVQRATLYAYVSRGLLRSVPAGGRSRERLYLRGDVDRLRRRGEERRNPTAIATHALNLGSPVLESAITLIDAGRLFYRGHDAVQLSRTRSVMDVAALIWVGQFDGLSAVRRQPARWPRAGDEMPFVTRAQAALALARTSNGPSPEVGATHVLSAGVNILSIVSRAAGGTPTATSTIDVELAAAWRLEPRAADILRAALVLCADHELNVSAFTARCVASSGASVYAAVIAALSALEGIRHGGATTRVEEMLASMRLARSGRAAVTRRLRLGESVYGFGHPLYPDGDPRARELFDLLRVRYPKSAELAFARSVADAMMDTHGVHPSLDFALATVSRVLRLPVASGLTLFAVGRTIGWIGHAIEQYAVGRLIRPRARYIGPRPAAEEGCF